MDAVAGNLSFSTGTTSTFCCSLAESRQKGKLNRKTELTWEVYCEKAPESGIWHWEKGEGCFL